MRRFLLRLTGLIFLLIHKRPFVRFHAMQSLITFGALYAINVILVFGGVFGGFAGGMMGGWMLGGISWLVYGLLSIRILVAWVVCMVKAFQGQRYKLPVVGNISRITRDMRAARARKKGSPTRGCPF